MLQASGLSFEDEQPAGRLRLADWHKFTLITLRQTAARKPVHHAAHPGAIETIVTQLVSTWPELPCQLLRSRTEDLGLQASLREA